MWGRAKIAVPLARRGFAASASTVGRILRVLIERGVLCPCRRCAAIPAAAASASPPGSATPVACPKGRKATTPGERVQIDTLFVNVRPDTAIEHFTAYDPVAKWTLGHAATMGSAACAAAPRQTPARVAVHGTRRTSRWRVGVPRRVEALCRDKKLELCVLPPRRPNLNGCAQSSWRYEFYACFELPYHTNKLQPLVDAFARRFNHHRPHQALGD